MHKRIGVSLMLVTKAMRSTQIRDTVRYMTCGDMLNCRVAMPELIIEENVCLERAQELPFRHASEKQSLIYANIPCAQRTDHPLVGRCGSRRHQRGADG